MAENLNPGDKTVADADYEKKFNKQPKSAEAKKLKEQEAAPDADWKTITKTKKRSSSDDDKGRFRFVGRRAGSFRNGSAFLFIVGVVMLGVMYTSVFAPNIILVNLKEMYVNDLADTTTALNTYYWKLMNYKIGQSQCSGGGSNENPSGDIKCKLSTMSRQQKLAFEKQGFTVLGSKVREDMRDDGQSGNEQGESRYQVMGIIPPATSPGFIATGDMLYLYAQLSSANKALVYNVFNPKSSFYHDTRFKERLKNRYGLSKSSTVGGSTEAEVRQAFDSSLNNDSGGIGLEGEPSKAGGVSLSSLANPSSALSYIAAAGTLAAPTTSYSGLVCSWYALANAVTNNAKTAKAHTVARFAMQYLKAADQIKVGTSQDITINTLSSNLAQSTGGGYSGPNATDSSMYKSIVYGGLPIPSPYGFLYYLDTFDLIGALAPAWAMLMASASGLGGVMGLSGSLAMPPANLGGGARDYCLSGEGTDIKTELKGQSTNDTRCPEAITALAPPGTQGAISEAIEVARRTCPPTNLEDDNPIQGFLGTWRGPVHNVISPSQSIAKATLTPIVAGIFSANAIAWANVMKLAFSSNTKGVAASDAIFAGTGEILGDMAMSRGMEPANAATLGIYLAQKESTDKQFEDVARYNARNQPFNVYNKYSFMGSIVNGLSPTYDSKAPLFSTIANSFTLLGDGLKRLDPSANAFYYLQPEIPPIDPLNPGATTAAHAAGLAKYLLRLNCPDPEYLAIGIMADTACNVRYVMGKQELLADPSSVLDYMLKSHSDLTQKNIDELQERLDKTAGDVEPGDRENVTRMLTLAKDAADKPQIDKQTGKAIEGSEYEKYLNYCVNRQDPWGRSGIAVMYRGLSNKEKLEKSGDKANNIDAISTNDSGNPYQLTPTVPYPSISEGATQDQDWYTGKKCLEQSEELTNFRAYTMLCSVDGSLSGAADCTDSDNSVGNSYTNTFYTSNDILFLSAG